MAIHTCNHCASIRLVSPLGEATENFTNKFSFKVQDILAASEAGCAVFHECTRLFRGLDNEDQTNEHITLRVGFRSGRVFLKFGNRRASWYEAYTNENDPCIAFVSARPANTDQNATQSFSLARDWLSSCLENAGKDEHDRCLLPKQQGFMPTLVLRIVPSNGSVRVNLYNPGQETRPYACLSYCWGGDQKTKLRASTRSAWLTEIPIADLPTIVTEAITVLLRLEVYYLWVDALCIMQDDPEDVSKQVGMMPQIYQNSTVTIIASTASTCYESFLNPTSPPPLHRAGLALTVELPSSERGTIYLRDCEDDAPFREPVSQRAWTLQENILSPRLLEYGYDRVRWSCRSIQISQGGSVQNPGQYSPRYIFYKSLDSGGEVDAHVKQALAWWRVVNDFTRRKLTFPTDKLPAISAIASELAANTEPRDDYLAGLWRRNLPLHLIWRADFPRKPRPRLYRAPSWSWAAVDSPVFHPHSTNGAEEWQKAAEITRCLKVIDCSTKPTSPAAKYSSVRSAHLVVEGFVIDATLVHKGTGYEIQTPSFLIQERTKCYYPDTIEGEEFLGSSSKRNVCLLLIIPSNTEYSPQGIVVTQPHDDGLYSRIGYFILKPSRTVPDKPGFVAPTGKGDLPPGAWARKIIKIV